MKIDNQRLDMAMAKACVDVKTLSELSGISKASLVAVRNKSRNPKPITIGKIARALEVPVEDLLEKEV